MHGGRQSFVATYLEVATKDGGDTAFILKNIYYLGDRIL